MKRFETRLPDGYAPVGAFDVTDKRVAWRQNLLALVLTAAVAATALFLLRPDNTVKWWHLLPLLILYPSYLVLHELLHGAALKALVRGQRLRFGTAHNAFYCGMPDVYLYRAALLMVLLTPFAAFTAVLTAGTVWLPTASMRVVAAILLALHIGGCTGDLYDTGLLLFRYRDPSTLTRDDGPRQIFYQKTED